MCYEALRSEKITQSGPSALLQNEIQVEKLYFIKYYRYCEG